MSGKAEQHAQPGHEEVGAGEALAQGVAGPAAGQRREQAGHDDDAAEHEVHRAQVALMPALAEVVRHPVGDAADGERGRRVAERAEDERGRFQDNQVVAPGGVVRPGSRVGQAARRLAHEQAEQGQQQAGRHDDEKGPRASRRSTPRSGRRGCSPGRCRPGWRRRNRPGRCRGVRPGRGRKARPAPRGRRPPRRRRPRRG